MLTNNSFNDKQNISYSLQLKYPDEFKNINQTFDGNGNSNWANPNNQNYYLSPTKGAYLFPYSNQSQVQTFNPNKKAKNPSLNKSLNIISQYGADAQQNILNLDEKIQKLSIQNEKLKEEVLKDVEYLQNSKRSRKSSQLTQAKDMSQLISESKPKIEEQIQINVTPNIEIKNEGENVEKIDQLEKKVLALEMEVANQKSLLLINQQKLYSVEEHSRAEHQAASELEACTHSLLQENVRLNTYYEAELERVRALNDQLQEKLKSSVMGYEETLQLQLRKNERLNFILNAKQTQEQSIMEGLQKEIESAKQDKEEFRVQLERMKLVEQPQFQIQELNNKTTLINDLQTQLAELTKQANVLTQSKHALQQELENLKMQLEQKDKDICALKDQTLDDQINQLIQENESLNSRLLEKSARKETRNTTAKKSDEAKQQYKCEKGQYIQQEEIFKCQGFDEEIGINNSNDGLNLIWRQKYFEVINVIQQMHLLSQACLQVQFQEQQTKPQAIESVGCRIESSQ